MPNFKSKTIFLISEYVSTKDLFSLFSQCQYFKLKNKIIK